MREPLVRRVRTYLLLVVALLLFTIHFWKAVDLNWGPRIKQCILVSTRFPFVSLGMGYICHDE